MQVPHIVMLLFALFATQASAFMPGSNIFEQLFNGGQQQQFQGQQQQQQQDGASDSSTYRMGYEGSEFLLLSYSARPWALAMPHLLLALTSTNHDFSSPVFEIPLPWHACLRTLSSSLSMHVSGSRRQSGAG